MRLRLRPPFRVARFGRAAEGATAVEFALIAFPFFMMLFAILEIALVFMIATTLEGAMSRSARTIRTGELQTGNAARSQPRSNSELAGDFKQQICTNLRWLQSQCAANLYVDVRTYAQFNDVSDPVDTSTGTFDTGSMTFTPGEPEDIVVVRTYFRWQVFTPLLNPGLVVLSDGSNLITATSIFRNEPFGE